MSSQNRAAGEIHKSANQCHLKRQHQHQHQHQHASSRAKMSNASAKITRQSTGPEMSDYVDNEIYNLCESIQDNGQPLKSGGIAQIKFIELFKLQSYVSNRLANVLSRARKSGFIAFKGEILMQGKDDSELITLLKMPRKVHQITKTQMIKK